MITVLECKVEDDCQAGCSADWLLYDHERRQIQYKSHANNRNDEYG